MVQTPTRTCIGCRSRASATELLRVVAAPDSTGSMTVVPDPRRHAGGRGAWVHPTTVCVEAAERRRAYSRALRVPGPVDLASVRAHVAGKPDSGAEIH